MLSLNNNDTKILRENFSDEQIVKLNTDNVNAIYNFLENEGVYFAKDIFLYYMNLFLYPIETFIDRFKKLEMENGDNYVEILAKDISLLSGME